MKCRFYWKILFRSLFGIQKFFYLDAFSKWNFIIKIFNARIKIYWYITIIIFIPTYLYWSIHYHYDIYTSLFILIMQQRHFLWSIARCEVHYKFIYKSYWWKLTMATITIKSHNSILVTDRFIVRHTDVHYFETFAE